MTSTLFTLARFWLMWCATVCRAYVLLCSQNPGGASSWSASLITTSISQTSSFPAIRLHVCILSHQLFNIHPVATEGPSNVYVVCSLKLKLFVEEPMWIHVQAEGLMRASGLHFPLWTLLLTSAGLWLAERAFKVPSQLARTDKSLFAGEAEEDIATITDKKLAGAIQNACSRKCRSFH